MKYFIRQSINEEDSLEDDHLINQMNLLNKLKKKRYLFRSSYRKEKNTFDMDDTLSRTSKNFNDEEFLYHFCITRDSFFLFLDEMKSKKPFTVSSNSSHQHPVAFQLLVFLYRIGKEGNGGNAVAVASFFGIGKGSVSNYVRRCVQALHEIKDEVVGWPDELERIQMRN